jgi:hypothetical protein
MKTKAAVLLSGALVALLQLSRYFALSRAGLPLGWLLYLGLPITAAGVLFALRLINLGAGWSTKAEKIRHDGAAVARPLALPPSGPSLSERLKELLALHASGAISDREYSAQRLHIISNMRHTLGFGRRSFAACAHEGVAQQ